jgi:catechol 2,3-dioxygenase-like lactoylglutathione lyase family enzyme
MEINNIDHLVITVQDLDGTIAFYTKVLGIKAVAFASGRKALAFGAPKINLHKTGEVSSLHSVYINAPDGNLIEIANRVEDSLKTCSTVDTSPLNQYKVCRNTFYHQAS